jgi:hypothetical protein
MIERLYNMSEQSEPLGAHGLPVKGLWFGRALETGGNTDARRVITDVVIPFNQGPMMPFLMSVGRSGRIQEKSVVFTDEAVAQKMVAGNHYHTPESDRHEVFVAMGESKDNEGKGLILMRYSLPGEGSHIGDFLMRQGDLVLIEPGVSHAFMPLVKGALLKGFSNLPYKAEHDVKHVLF